MTSNPNVNPNVDIVDYVAPGDLNVQVISASSLLIPQSNYIDSLAFDKMFENISMGNLASGVFGATGTDEGVEMGVDNATNVSYLQSKNYVSGVIGWRLDGDGIVHAVGGAFSGYIQVGGGAADINAGSTTINGGMITTNSLIVGTNVAIGTAQNAGQVTTIIGNTVTTGFMFAHSIQAASVAAENIIGTTITGKTVRTSASGTRVELSANSNAFDVYQSGSLVGEIAASSAAFGFFNGSGSLYAILGSSGFGLYQGNIVIPAASAYSWNRGGNGFIDSPSTTSIRMSTNLSVVGSVLPYNYGYYDLGSPSYYWRNLYSSGNIYGTQGNFTSTLNTAGILAGGGKIDIGYTGAYDILPYSDNYGSLGYKSGYGGRGYNRRWGGIYGVSIVAGDLGFDNDFKFTEEGKTGLALFNQRNEKIAVFMDNGDLIIKGKVVSESNL